MQRGSYGIKNVPVKILIYLFIFSIISVSMFKDYVNAGVVHKLLPKDEVTIVLDAPALTEIQSGDRNTGQPGSDGFLRKTQDDDYVLIYRMTVFPEEYILIQLNENVTQVCYHSNFVSETVHEFTEQEIEDGEFRLYPYAFSPLRLVYSLVIYAVAACIAFAVFLSVHLLLTKGRFLPRKIWDAELRHPVRWFFAVWCILYVVALCQYIFHIGTPHYVPDNALGDQGHYWSTYIIGSFGLDFNMVLPTSFRGWTNYSLSSLAQWIGKVLSIDPVKVWLLFPSLFLSWMITGILPGYYRTAEGKNPKIISVLLFGAIFTFYWDTFLIGVLTDMFSLVLFLASLLCLIHLREKPSFLRAAGFGVLLSLLCNCRLQYFYGMLIIAACYGVKALIDHRSRRDDPLRQSALYKQLPIGKKAVMVLVIAACFFVVAIPQLIYNLNAGYAGILPYDAPEAYGGHPVTWSGWNTFLSRGMVLWPRFIGDDQIMSFKTQLYPVLRSEITPIQAMDVYANSPMETIIILWKKAFTMLDIKSNVNYIDGIAWRNTPNMLFSYFNYLFLSIGFYVLLHYSRIGREEKCFCWFVFAGTFLPMLQGHSEWRGSIVFYTILIFMLCYRFIGEILPDETKYTDFCDGKFFRFITLAEMLCFGISFTLWA